MCVSEARELKTVPCACHLVLVDLGILSMPYCLYLHFTKVLVLLYYTCFTLHARSKRPIYVPVSRFLRTIAVVLILFCDFLISMRALTKSPSTCSSACLKSCLQLLCLFRCSAAAGSATPWARPQQLHLPNTGWFPTEHLAKV